MSAFLILNAHDNTGVRFELSPKDPTLLGRDWQCRIVLNDPQCSRTHAQVFRDEEGWWICDNNSSNGTYVNGQSIDQARLVEGTEIRIGSSQLTFTEKATTSSTTEETEEGPSTGHLTVVLDRSMDSASGGGATLEFLRGRDWGKDFFFLFHLAVKLLSVIDPKQVIAICLPRLARRTQGDIAGFLWLTDQGQLTPWLVIPEDRSDELELNADLTRRVVSEKQAIRVERDTAGKVADSICVPLMADDRVIGALHLYRQSRSFDRSVFELTIAVSNIMARSLATAHRHSSLAAEHSRLVQKSATFDQLLGECEPMRVLKSKIGRVAQALGSVLIRGESGSGKELVARAIHRLGKRANRPLLSVNCAAIAPELMESQLFGHKKGAFTSADRDHLGWFQQADRGTLFLDEIGELTPEGQAKLLRILEGHPFLPVGATEEVSVDVRVICATNQDLQQRVDQKEFREDLYYRLNVYELTIPPLRERGDDLPMLIEFFLNHFRTQHGKPQAHFSPKAMERLLAYSWPGNVRQLRNVIDSAIVMAEGDRIDPVDLGIRSSPQAELETLRIDHWERKLIIDALKRTRQSVTQAAKLLGISRATLYRKIDDYQIEKPS